MCVHRSTRRALEQCDRRSMSHHLLHEKWLEVEVALCSSNMRAWHLWWSYDCCRSLQGWSYERRRIWPPPQLWNLARPPPHGAACMLGATEPRCHPYDVLRTWARGMGVCFFFAGRMGVCCRAENNPGTCPSRPGVDHRGKYIFGSWERACDSTSRIMPWRPTGRIPPSAPPSLPPPAPPRRPPLPPSLPTPPPPTVWSPHDSVPGDVVSPCQLGRTGASVPLPTGATESGSGSCSSMGGRSGCRRVDASRCSSTETARQSIGLCLRTPSCTSLAIRLTCSSKCCCYIVDVDRDLALE